MHTIIPPVRQLYSITPKIPIYFLSTREKNENKKYIHKKKLCSTEHKLTNHDTFTSTSASCFFFLFTFHYSSTTLVPFIFCVIPYCIVYYMECNTYCRC